MTQKRWDIPEVEDDDQGSPVQQSPTLVSLHFIRTTLRRRWLLCALSAILGLLMAVTFLVAFPQPHRAKSSLVLAHEEGVDPSLAMSTDVGFLRSQAVAAKTVASLGLTVTPDGFLKSVTIERVSPEMLSITVAAPTDEEAVRRLQAFTSIYLDFRGKQLSLQSDVLIAAMQERMKKLDGEVAALSRRVDQLAKGGSSNASKLSETIAQRAYLQSRIENMQQSIEDATLRNAAVVSSSRVVDPATVERGRAKRRMVLVLASGLIGGTAFGCGMVLFFAITSDRLRRRSDIAEALEAPVPISVGRVAPIPKRLRWVPHLRVVNIRRAGDRERLAHAIEQGLPMPGRWGRLAVACIDNADEVRFAVAAAATNLVAKGCSVTLIDLSEQTNFDVTVLRSISDSTDMPAILRPGGVPALAGDATDLRAVGLSEDDPSPTWPQLTDITLVLADLDPAVGADYLTAWSDRVIVAVTAGRSSAERIRTAGDLIRTAGLEMRFAALLRAESADDSSGVAGFDRPTLVQNPDVHDQREAAKKSGVR